jgi:predicted Zn finger-like uncharacterized protein
MRLSCPSCQTEYDVPDAALTGRTRKLRCVNCGNQWEAGPIGVSELDSGPTPTAAELEYMQRPRAAAATGVAYGAAEKPDRQEISQDFSSPPPVSRPAEVPQRVDPAEARHQADRESFAALLEASRQPGSQTSDAPVKTTKKLAGRAVNPWLISVLILLLAVGLIFLEREHIMAAWPPSIRFFVALGLR